jgi:streptogrisin C
MSSRRVVLPTLAILVCLISALACQAAIADSLDALPDSSGSSTATSGATLPTDAFEKDVAEMSRVLGVPIDEMRTDLLRQELVGKMNAALLDLGPSVFGGLFVDYEPAYQINVLAAPGKSNVVARASQAAPFDSLLPFIHIAETTHTQAVLVNTMDAVRQLSDAITASDIDLRNGLVLVYTNPADVDRVRALVDSASLPIPSEDVLVEAGGFVDQVNSYGGLRLSSPIDYCTSGFSVSSTIGLPDGITDAGHCANNNVTEQGITLNFVDGKIGGDQDVQWFKTPGMTDINKIKDSASNLRSITSRTGRYEMYISEAVCHYGVTSGYSCGTIVSTTANVGGLDPDHTYNDTWIRVGGSIPGSPPNFCEGGDSGGPWFFGNSAFGIHKGRFSNYDCAFMAQNFMNVLNIVVKIH